MLIICKCSLRAVLKSSVFKRAENARKAFKKVSKLRFLCNLEKYKTNLKSIRCKLIVTVLQYRLYFVILSLPFGIVRAKIILKGIFCTGEGLSFRIRRSNFLKDPKGIKNSRKKIPNVKRF